MQLHILTLGIFKSTVENGPVPIQSHQESDQRHYHKTSQIEVGSAATQIWYKVKRQHENQQVNQGPLPMEECNTRTSNHRNNATPITYAMEFDDTCYIRIDSKLNYTGEPLKTDGSLSLDP